MALDHLSLGQRTAIKEAAIEATYNDARQNDDYLHDLIEQRIDSIDVEEQVTAISSDPDMLPKLLDFDPTTGQKWREE